MSSSAFMEMRPVYQLMSSRYSTSHPPNELMLYVSSRNVPNTMPLLITAQYPSLSTRRSAKRMRWRAVRGFFSLAESASESESESSAPSPPLEGEPFVGSAMASDATSRAASSFPALKGGLPLPLRPPR